MSATVEQAKVGPALAEQAGKLATFAYEGDLRAACAQVAQENFPRRHRKWAARELFRLARKGVGAEEKAPAPVRPTPAVDLTTLTPEQAKDAAGAMVEADATGVLRDPQLFRDSYVHEWRIVFLHDDPATGLEMQIVRTSGGKWNCYGGHDTLAVALAEAPEYAVRLVAQRKETAEEKTRRDREKQAKEDAEEALAEAIASGVAHEYGCSIGEAGVHIGETKIAYSRWVAAPSEGGLTRSESQKYAAWGVPETQGPQMRLNVPLLSAEEIRNLSAR